MTSRPCDAYGPGPGVSPLRHYLNHRAADSPPPVLDVIEYTDSNAHWNAEASDPYLHWLERAGGTLGARPARHAQP